MSELLSVERRGEVVRGGTYMSRFGMYPQPPDSPGAVAATDAFPNEANQVNYKSRSSPTFPQFARLPQGTGAV